MASRPHTMRTLRGSLQPCDHETRRTPGSPRVSSLSGAILDPKTPGRKIVGFHPMCVCEETLYYYSIPENQENPESPRNSAGFRVSGLSEFQKIATRTLRVALS